MPNVILAGVAESVDAGDSKSPVGDYVRVRVPPPAPFTDKTVVA